MSRDPRGKDTAAATLTNVNGQTLHRHYPVTTIGMMRY